MGGSPTTFETQHSSRPDPHMTTLSQAAGGPGLVDVGVFWDPQNANMDVGPVPLDTDWRVTIDGTVRPIDSLAWITGTLLNITVDDPIGALQVRVDFLVQSPRTRNTDLIEAPEPQTAILII